MRTPDPDDVPSQEEPYDPDMTVEEALRKGIIAMIDTGTIASNRYEPCGFFSPYEANKVADGHYDPGLIRCTRLKGHAGVHAFVQRWNESFIERDNLLKAKRAKEEAEARLKQERAAKREAELRALQDAGRAMQQQLSHAAKGAAKAVGDLNKSMHDIQIAANHRADSMVFGPASKKARFRDQSAGKVRRR